MKKLTTTIDPSRKNVLWYNGEVWRMEIGKYIVSCAAVGKVKATLYDENDIILECVKDDDNRGLFRKKLSPYIKNDAELIQLIESDRLHLTAANWLECSFLNTETREKSILSISVDDTEDVELSFLEADEKEYAGYCRQAFGNDGSGKDPVLEMLLKNIVQS